MQIMYDRQGTVELAFTEAIDLELLKEKYGLERDSLVSSSIGYDDGVYLLFSSHIPERIQGMFVDTAANAEYKALCLWVDWESGELIGEELLSFGVQKMNFHFIQPVGEYILLLGARVRQYKDGTEDQNAVFVSRRGTIISSICMGDGIEDCIALEDGRIITSYFDEGIFESPAGDRPGASGLAVWNQQGKVLWKNTRYPIWDCYAINIDEQNNLWFYYYGEFNLVKTDFESDCIFQPGLRGSGAFLITKSQSGILMEGGYEERDSWKFIQLLGHTVGAASDVIFTFNGNPVRLERYSFRSSKAVIMDGEQHLFCLDIV